MLRKAVISLALCAALAAWCLPGVAAAEDATQPGSGTDSNGEPVDVGGIVGGALEEAAGTVTGTVEGVTGGGSTQAPPAAEVPSGNPGKSAGAGTVGKVVTGAGKAVERTVGTVKGDVEAVTGTGHASHPKPPPAATPPTSAPAPADSAPAPKVEAAATSSAATPPAEEAVAVPSRPETAAPHRPAFPAARSHPGVAPTRQISHPLESDSGAHGLSSAAAGTADPGHANATETSHEALATSQAVPDASRADPAAEEGSGPLLTAADFTPGHPLGTLLFVLVIAVGALALAAAMRRELGLHVLPRRRPHG